MGNLNKRGLAFLVQAALSRPQALAFLPALSLGAFWIGGESWLLLTALGLPVIYALSDALGPSQTMIPAQMDAVDDVIDMSGFEQAVQAGLARSAQRGRPAACLMVGIDDFDDLRDRYGAIAADHLTQRVAQRITGVLRDDDVVVRLPDGVFGLMLAPMQRLDLESAIQISARLQAHAQEPLSLDATTVYLSCSVGFCLASRSPGPGATALLEATDSALREAQRHGPSAIRAYTERLRPRLKPGEFAASGIRHALDSGQIVPWFQPQISTHTGRITGFEALARWEHPDRGVLTPADFLPQLTQSGQLERLSEVILFHALTALRKWDAAGHQIPRIGVNFAPDELQNPKLVQKVQWDLDRFDLAPQRLTVEVLETVIAANPDDIVVRNINGLAKLGCGIDLDDFGTGHASIPSIRRFAVNRIKIDRSFVSKVDRDPEQQRMVNAILTMADKLDIDTLAEGVETHGEHAILAQLGCGHVQGFSIARPMPFSRTLDWMGRHKASLQQAPPITGTIL